MQVTITRRHITNGMPCHAEKCPIALALLEALGTSRYVSVGTDSYAVSLVDSGTHTYRLTKRAASFIGRFDRSRGAVRPCTMELGRMELGRRRP